MQGSYKHFTSNNKLIEALKSHDLYAYSGHGDGLNINFEEKIQELNGCAAPVLLGCDSGVRRLNGLYAPEGDIDIGAGTEGGGDFGDGIDIGIGQELAIGGGLGCGICERLGTGDGPGGGLQIG
ncbi:separase isoform X2 [Olea europaea subsp. europaea]|uniref:Separase isoform X2 n=1 Tax=Olea europaea subsp. europaea TaxID=158383 RepID=A0A8S0U7K7_OLEEU|nr:separase isoform X2 [Olea europaea subsp. europaea]